MVGKNERTWLTVERFSEENPLFVPERGSVLRSWLRQKTTNGIMIFDLIQGRVYALGKYEGRFFPLFQLLPDPRTHTLDPVLGERPRTWTRSVGTKNVGAKHQNNELLSLRRTWTRSVGTKNGSACLDPKSPLERGGTACGGECAL